MRTLAIILFLSGVSLFAERFPPGPLVSSKAPASAGGGSCACTGAFVDGNTERFESGAGAFCTTTWTETDASGLIDTFASDQSVTCGHSWKYTFSGSHAVAITQTQVGTDAAFTLRFYVRWNGVDDSASGESLRLFTFDDTSNPVSGNNLEVFVRRNASSVSLRLGTSGGPDLTEDTWYRVELDIVTSGTCTMRTFAIGGSELGSGVTATSAGACYHIFHGTDAATSTLSANASIWVDNLIYDAASTYPIGADE